MNFYKAPVRQKLIGSPVKDVKLFPLDVFARQLHDGSRDRAGARVFDNCLAFLRRKAAS
jgi:hypothetical protein